MSTREHTVVRKGMLLHVGRTRLTGMTSSLGSKENGPHDEGGVIGDFQRLTSKTTLRTLIRKTTVMLAGELTSLLIMDATEVKRISAVTTDVQEPITRAQRMQVARKGVREMQQEETRKRTQHTRLTNVSLVRMGRVSGNHVRRKSRVKTRLFRVAVVRIVAAGGDKEKLHEGEETQLERRVVQKVGSGKERNYVQNEGNHVQKEGKLHKV